MKRCIIHIGMHKTGSSSIQSSLRGFQDDHFHYANLGGVANHSLAMYSLFASQPELHHLHAIKGAVAAAVQTYNVRMRADLESSIDAAGDRTLLISGENISLLPQVDLIKLHEYFHARCDDVVIVGYVRPPSGYLASGFQQRVQGAAGDQFDLQKVYRNYRSAFSKFDEVFGRGKVLLWKFDPKTFPNGCAVQDFCSRLNIALSSDQIKRVNESLSRQAVNMLYTYRMLGPRPLSRIMKAPESRELAALLTGIRQDKFRLSPDVVRPVLDANRADIAWMEERLGQSLQENLGDPLPGDVRDATDLLQPDPEVVSKLLSLLGDVAPPGVRGDSPEEVALLVHHLRKWRKSAVTVKALIKQMHEQNPNVLDGIEESQAIAFIRNIFDQMSVTLGRAEEGMVKFDGLGHFRVKKAEQNADGGKVVHNRVVFHCSEADKDQEIIRKGTGV